VYTQTYMSTETKHYPIGQDARQGFVAKCFRGKDNRLALAQRPNLPIIIWAMARLAVLVLSGPAVNVARAIAFGALFTWAFQEVFQGVNYFRRALGLVVLSMLIISVAHSGHLT
jgi:hypothetical protein